MKPLGWERTSTTLTDMDMNYLLLYLEENYGLTSEKKVQSAIKIVANENRYHPVRDYLNSLQWDGTERVFRPGSKFEVMLCLVGGQGAGKSTFFRLLAGRDEWFSDDLKKLDDENVYRKLQGHWIIEMSEMIATANAKVNNQVILKPPERNLKVRMGHIQQTGCGNIGGGGTTTGRTLTP